MFLMTSIGEKIKDLREYYGISQKALCDGICSQAYISRLEKGEINVSADILFLLSKRLGVEVNFFFNNYQSPSSDYLSITMNEINEATRNRNYRHLEEIVSLELKTPSTNENTEIKQFLLWHKGICVYHLNNEVGTAIKYIDQALAYSLTTNRNYSEREIEILLSKAIILFDSKNYKLSQETFEMITYNLKNNIYLVNPRIHIRAYYNYSRLLYEMGKYHEVIEASMKGIQQAKNYELLYLMGDLYFQVGRGYEKLCQFEKAYSNFEKSKNCFELNNEEELVELAQERIEELVDKSKSKL